MHMYPRDILHSKEEIQNGLHSLLKRGSSRLFYGVEITGLCSECTTERTIMQDEVSHLTVVEENHFTTIIISFSLIEVR